MEEATRLVYKEAVKLVESGKVAKVADSAADGALTFLVLAAVSGLALALIAWRDRNTRGKRLGEWAYTLSAGAVVFSLFMSFVLFIGFLSYRDNQMSCAVGMVTGAIEDNIDDPGYMYELGTE